MQVEERTDVPLRAAQAEAREFALARLDAAEVIKVTSDALPSKDRS